MAVKTIITNILTPIAVWSILVVTTAFAEFSPNMISAPEVKQMVENGDTAVIHVLSHIEYLFQHIPGSINIPVDELASSTRLPGDKHKPVVFYCMGQR
jgi:rhodanese-related sulfurtransferase